MHNLLISIKTTNINEKLKDLSLRVNLSALTL